MNSSAKGKRFERKAAQLLSEWSGLDLGRTPMSGAWVNEPGDVVALNNTFFPFVVECKHEEGWKLDNLLQYTNPFPAWISQTVTQVEKKSKSTGELYWPMLLFTRNRSPIYVLAPASVLTLGGNVVIRQSHIVYIQSPWTFVVGEASILQGISFNKVQEYHDSTRYKHFGQASTKDAMET